MFEIRGGYDGEGAWYPLRIIIDRLPNSYSHVYLLLCGHFCRDDRMVNKTYQCCACINRPSFPRCDICAVGRSA